MSRFPKKFKPGLVTLGTGILSIFFSIAVVSLTQSENVGQSRAEAESSRATEVIFQQRV